VSFKGHDLACLCRNCC